MSKIAFESNVSGTGTFTIASPGTNTNRILTLPDAAATLVGDSATQTLTNKSIDGSQLTGSVASSLLTGALPAISGAALTGIVTGGMTLLGTLTCTSGTTQTLSGLNLSTYAFIYISFSNLTYTGAGNNFLGLGGGAITPSVPGGDSLSGIVTIQIRDAGSPAHSIINNASTLAVATLASSGGFGGYTTATTSLSFAYVAARTFVSGVIRVYGGK